MVNIVKVYVEVKHISRAQERLLCLSFIVRLRRLTILFQKKDRKRRLKDLFVSILIQINSASGAWICKS